MKMNVKVGISNRHVHLTLETYKKLFVYAGAEHKQMAQKPVSITID